MSLELEQAGLPLAFSSTKVTKSTKTEKNRKKKAQKKNKKRVGTDNNRVKETDSEGYNYAEEFKVLEVLEEYKNPFTILMPKSDRFKPEEPEEEEDQEEFYETSCDLDCIEKPKSKGDPLQKYYHQRYDYFSLFDEGIQIDQEGWYSVTPEIIAKHIAKEAHTIALTNKSNEDSSATVILDAFCGVGGNTIQFAKYFDKVIAVELDAGRLEMARYNATIYGVADRIEFVHGDVFQVLPEFTGQKHKNQKMVDLVFMSPPWGGPAYINQEIFYANSDLLEGRGQELFDLARSVCKNLILFLPRQSDIFCIAEMVKKEKYSRGKTRKIDSDDSFVVEQHWLRNRLKAISVYFY